MRRSLFILFCLSLIAVAAGGVKAWQWLQAPGEFAARTYTIEAGDSLAKVARELKAEGVIEYPQVWQWYGRYTKAAARIKAGEYSLEANLSPQQLLDVFVGGEVVLHRVTLIEGSRSRDAMRLLQDEALLTALDCEDLQACVTEALELEQYASLEGLFFADTYAFSRGTGALDVLRMASDRLQQVLAQEWERRAKDLPYESAYEALIMASIIEKETAVPSERAEIAGVFVRRLKKGMRLQTDPTVIYGLGDAYDGNIRSRDLKADNAYNTYRIHGLPPTPIALVGREAIHAALHPADGKALFFVARGDGTHVFSETLAQHNRAVQQYQVRKRRKDYRSTPKASGNSQ
jgi:UPF0755 protein